MNFAAHNAFPHWWRSRECCVLFCSLTVFPKRGNFDLQDSDRRFLLAEMSRWTGESSDPAYPRERYTT